MKLAIEKLNAGELTLEAFMEGHTFPLVEGTRVTFVVNDEGDVRAVAAGAVLDGEHGHRAGDDAGHRPHRAPVVAGLEPHAARLDGAAGSSSAAGSAADWPTGDERMIVRSSGAAACGVAGARVGL